MHFENAIKLSIAMCYNFFSLHRCLMKRPTDVLVLTWVALERCVNSIVNILREYISSQNKKNDMGFTDFNEVYE